ncbi:response regulator [Prosthecochloris sp. GSB1]|uniref:response regulator transcription factor n=1 Tax=Prosthecochloris sp. GSB1 TaxID=281093 RepID=UPI000B8C7793|nr:response regulator transcription factor [Prosthecochloris sp. GSB1]ASQ90275.1 response regulator [Prosthecochloris sp. GSB1]
MNKPRILVVDDSANIRRLLSHNLGKYFDVSAAAGAEEAFGTLEKGGPPDLIVVDVAMPGMDGFSFVESIRKTPALKAVPVIMLTAKDKSSEKEKGLRVGADDYITKPFSMDDLAARIRSLLDL